MLIIQSKYFPDSDWLKAELDKPKRTLSKMKWTSMDRWRYGKHVLAMFLIKLGIILNE